MNYILEMENIVKRFGRTAVVDDVTLQIREGETVSIIGSSGAGKSTLLRCVNQLELIQGGRIVLDGEELARTDETGRVRYIPERRLRQARQKTAMVFQHFNLFPHLTCLENITVTGIKVRGEAAATVTERGLALLARVGLADKANRYPSQLSGGQKQRVAIARALALNPRIMLLDEPTSALDPEITGEVLAVIRELAAERMTMLIVTHEIGFAREVSDRTLFMDDGKVVEEGSPKAIFENPKTERLQTFLRATL